jgi:hypothetical protein
MRYPGAYQMGHFIRFFEALPWWTLVPDVKHKAVVSGYGDWAKPNYVTTAVSEDRKLMVSYLPQLQALSVDFNFLSGNSFTCTWFNPATGKNEKSFVVTEKTVRRLGPPNGEDWVLVIKAD